MSDSITSAKTYEEFKKIISSEGGFILAGWCESENCESAIKEETGAKITNMPLDKKASGKCIYCGKPAKKIAYFAKSY